jgi:hypothetical protein
MKRLDDHDTTEGLRVTWLSNQERRAIGNSLVLSRDEVLLFGIARRGQRQGR